MLKEEWKDIEGWEGYYKISNLGRVLSVKRGIFKVFDESNRGGYLRVQLCNNEKKKKLAPEDYEEYKSRFPASSDVPSTYIKTCAEFDEKLKYISNNMQDGPYSSEEWDEHMKNLKGLSES